MAGQWDSSSEPLLTITTLSIVSDGRQVICATDDYMRKSKQHITRA